tara:strand:+ start:842 stop:1156 length:315 start_codon:yes stop_codon:yes gene_type:complete
MRKIEEQMNRAIRNRQRWQSGNTSVIIGHENEVDVYLHGNHIATVSPNAIRIFDGGWQSNTTKSRLNALLYEFQYGARVFQKNFEWFLSKRNGQTLDFESGMTV